MSRLRMKVSGREEWLSFDLELGREGAFTWEDGALALQGRVVASPSNTGVVEGWLDIDGRITPFAACRVKDRVHVWAGGVTVWLDLDTGQKRGKGPAAAGGDDILAPMPGTVLKVHVAVGAAVEANQAVMVMESMKMELTLHAPRAGRIEAVLAAEGALVDLGAVLARLEKEAPKA